MTENKLKEIAIKFTDGIWNTKIKSVIHEYIHNNALIHSSLGDFYGPKAMEHIVDTWLKGFPDLHIINDYIIAENDMVVIGWHIKATHWGEFKGIKPTGKAINFNGVLVYRIQNGQIVEYWAHIDMYNVLKMLTAHST